MAGCVGCSGPDRTGRRATPADSKCSDAPFALINLQIEVEDTGFGIPADQQEVIFDSFKQQDGQNTRKYDETGLGLAITKRLVEMMNGHISVRSKIGAGSVLEITLREGSVCCGKLRVRKAIVSYAETLREYTQSFDVNRVEEALTRPHAHASSSRFSPPSL
ncbi:MAG: hypothetical protein GY801_12040 [bacterium]|nr:hypothetical protein [bacterium]